ncbi:putative WSC domain-containing protein [Rosellinia necatrix]|uniref:Putative WSC domain-containing protein n=1 Tax=Rosellinia necatrix TaxID=77044 RepID=A0A1S7UM18_ROSNE|nr:putative WSC domain-containing protein [Rosellinia necatrix]
MRWNALFLSAALSLSTLTGADPTWPAATDELEEIMYQVQGYRSRQFGGTVIPCSSQASGPGRHNAAEWLRAAFHDMATTTIAGGPRQGGLDGSLQYELTSSDNIGPAFTTTLKFMADYYTSRSSVADLLALGVYYAVRSCGGPVVPIAGGRIDAKEGGPLGVPLPQNTAFTFGQQFARMGFSQTEMIQVVACGHTLGGVHETEFPQIVPVGTTANGEAPMDSTVDAFDNKIVTEYISGNTTNPMVVGPSVQATRNSDFKVFNVDGNATVTAMADPETFSSICATVLRKMIEVVPDDVVLTEPIQPYAVKPVDMQLTLNAGASTMQLSGLIRVRTTEFGADSAESVSLTFKDRSGGNECGDLGCTHTAELLGATEGFDDTFVWFPISIEVPTSSGISSFTLTVNMASGTSEAYDNNGEAYPIQDAILMQKPQSCLLEGTLNVVAAVRNDLESSPVNLRLSYKTPVDNPNRVVPTLNDEVVEMTKGDCVGLYTFYTATYQGLGELDYATKIDVVTGTGESASRDAFKAASGLGATCAEFDAPPAELCSRAGDPDPPETSTSVTMTPTVTSPGTATSTAAVETPYHRDTLGNYTLVGCNTEPTVAGARALSGASYVYDGMTLESCMTNCTGFYYWGTEYGRECYCGNKVHTSSTNVTLDECNIVCSGDETEYCGAGDRLELYVTNAPIPTPTGTLAIKPTVTPYLRVGCYEELPSRALTGGVFPSDSMTLELCAESCDGFTYFATEYGRECYCGQFIDPRSNVTDDADCNIVCAGDETEYCGGSDRLEMYRLINPPTSTSMMPTPTVTPTHKPTVSSYAFQGCWTEGDGVRALDAKSTAADDVTLESCADFCQDYHYFGTEFGRECHCGDSLAASSNETDLADCSVPCAGDPSEYCGAGNRLNLYYSNTTAGPSQPLVVGNYSWFGCQTEGAGVRALAAKSLVDAEMTLDACAAFCEGSVYFGAEYGVECYCGDEFGEGSVAAPTGQCNVACGGDATQLCGAGDRLSVYELTPPETPDEPGMPPVEEE